jgi:hypothetical protein
MSTARGRYDLDEAEAANEAKDLYGSLPLVPE